MLASSTRQHLPCARAYGREQADPSPAAPAAEREARAANVTRLAARAQAVLARADEENHRDLTAAERRQVFALCDRAERLRARG